MKQKEELENESNQNEIMKRNKRIQQPPWKQFYIDSIRKNKNMRSNLKKSNININLRVKTLC
jgi:hypothetical protein